MKEAKNQAGSNERRVTIQFAAVVTPDAKPPSFQGAAGEDPEPDGYEP